MRSMRFTIVGVFYIVLLCAVSVGWFVDRSRQEKQIEDLQAEAEFSLSATAFWCQAGTTIEHYQRLKSLIEARGCDSAAILLLSKGDLAIAILEVFELYKAIVARPDSQLALEIDPVDLAISATDVLDVKDLRLFLVEQLDYGDTEYNKGINPGVFDVKSDDYRLMEQFLSEIARRTE